MSCHCRDYRSWLLHRSGAQGVQMVLGEPGDVSKFSLVGFKRIRFLDPKP